MSFQKPNNGGEKGQKSHTINLQQKPYIWLKAFLGKKKEKKRPLLKMTNTTQESKFGVLTFYLYYP
jgi:hypothetical protein